MNAVAVLLGVALATGILLTIDGFRPSHTSSAHGGARQVRRSLLAHRLRLLQACGAALVVLIVTRWPVAAVGAGALGWFARDLLGGQAARAAGIARTEAIASWAEMLRDTISAAHGLEAAIEATAPIAPEPIRREIMALAADLERLPLPVALRQLADDLAHPIADLVVAALAVAANGSVRELSDLLGTLAASARDEAAMMLRADAARARIRTAVRLIASCTLAMAVGLIVLNPAYVASYRTVVGQVVLAAIVGCWGAALWWLSSMSRFQTPERFLVATERKAST